MSTIRNLLLSRKLGLLVLTTLILPYGFFVNGVSAKEEKDPKKAKFAAISQADTMIMVPMRDGVKLATDVYLPKGDGPFPTVFVKTPYNFNKIKIWFANIPGCISCFVSFFETIFD